MIELDTSIREGHYAKKQILCRDPLIAWSHGSRLAMGLRLAAEIGADRVLDHGCGDGTFLAMLRNTSQPPSVRVGSELHEDLVDDCRSRLGQDRGLRFILSSELDQPEHGGAYDLVACMEVLEHVLDLDSELKRMERLLEPGGRVLISVPVEIGPALIVKQIVRSLAGWRGLGHYPGTSPYTLRELAAGLLAGDQQHIPRPVFDDGKGTQFHDHKGFNFRVLHRLVGERFHLEKVLSSPLPWMPPRLASQVWLIARKK